MSHLYCTFKVHLKFPKFMMFPTIQLCLAILPCRQLKLRLHQGWYRSERVCDRQHHGSFRRPKSVHYSFTFTKRGSGLAGGCTEFYMFPYPNFEDVASVWFLISCQKATLALGKWRCGIDTSGDEVLWCGKETDFFVAIFIYKKKKEGNREQFICKFILREA